MQHSSKCGSWTESINITLKCVRNAKSQALPQTNYTNDLGVGLGICVLDSPGDSDVVLSLRNTDLVSPNSSPQGQSVG